jgi:ABC-type maltose transport system permease subunit
MVNINPINSFTFSDHHLQRSTILFSVYLLVSFCTAIRVSFDAAFIDGCNNLDIFGAFCRYPRLHWLRLLS